MAVAEMTDSLAKAIIAGSGFTEHEIQQLCHHWLTSRAELDQLRQRVGEVEAKRDLNARMLTEELTRNEHLEAKLALAEQDARRYRWLRDNCHHNEYDGRDWPHAVIVLQWHDGSHICKFHPDKNAPGVGLISLDSAIDSVMQRAAIDASQN